MSSEAHVSGSSGSDVTCDDAGEPPSCRSRVHIVERAAIADIECPTLKVKLDQIAAICPFAVANWTVVLVDDAEMSRLHEAHRGSATTTDVLSFNLSESSSDPVEAEVVVCVDAARREASDRDHAVEREVLLYSLHGLLHCAGYDDHDEESFRRMHAVEDALLERAGIGATFAPGESPIERGMDT